MSIKTMRSIVSGGVLGLPIDMAGVTSVRETELGCMVRLGAGPIYVDLAEEYGLVLGLLESEEYSLFPLPRLVPSPTNEGDGTAEMPAVPPA